MTIKIAMTMILYAVLSVSFVVLVLEVLTWWHRRFGPRGRITTGDFDIDQMRRIARAAQARAYAERATWHVPTRTTGASRE